MYPDFLVASEEASHLEFLSYCILLNGVCAIVKRNHSCFFKQFLSSV